MKTWRDNYTGLSKDGLFVERIRLEEDLFSALVDLNNASNHEAAVREELNFVKGLLNEDTDNKG